MCVSPRQLVSELVGWVPCLLLRKKESVPEPWPRSQRWLSQCLLLQPPPPTAASPIVAACLLWCPSFFCKVKEDDDDDECRMQTSAVRPCVTVPPMTPWGGVLRSPASCPHPRSVRVLKPETFSLCVVSQNQSNCMLSAYNVSVCRWINMQDPVETKNMRHLLWYVPLQPLLSI